MKENELNSRKIEASYNKNGYFLSKEKNKKSELYKQSKDKKIYLNSLTNNFKPIKFYKFKCYERQNKRNSKTIKNIFLIYVTIIILLYRNEILCESYITLKINKKGKYKILFNEGIELTNHYCSGVQMHSPTLMTINENIINPPTDEYQFAEQNNSIKLVYPDSKEKYNCLFF